MRKLALFLAIVAGTVVATVARLLKQDGSLGKVAGYLPLGSACGELMLENRKGAWYTVNREDVQLNKDGRKSPNLIVAKCSA
ncbi:MAG TPA: hypothetical protein PKC95_00185 [Thauera aminoaromatica]|nr:hypothetical protein [Thauera aminoaromatica]